MKYAHNDILQITYPTSLVALCKVLGITPVDYKLIVLDSDDGSVIGLEWWPGVDHVDKNKDICLAFDTRHMYLEKDAPVGKHKCRCDIFSVVNFGCKCGGI